MNRRRNIIRFGQEDQSDMADSVDAAEDRDSTADTYGESVRSDGGQYDLTEDMAYADPAFDAEEPRRAGWIVPALAVVAIAAWTGFFAYAQFIGGAMPTGFADWTALIAQWSMPVALILSLIHI